MGNSATKANLKTNPKGKGRDDKRVIKKTDKKGRSKGIFTRRKPSLVQPPKGPATSMAPLQLTSFEPVEAGVNLTSNPNEEVVNRLRSQLKTDLQTFVLNNVLMSIQFFENYEREIGCLRLSPMSEREVDRNTRLLQCQKHCLSPDKLHEVASKHVRFRPQYGSRKHCTELLVPPRLLVVQDNVELYEGTDSVDYSSVLSAPVYRLTMENADKHGYVKLRSDDKRRPTYEVIEDKKSDYDATYSRIAGDDSTPSPRGSDKVTKLMDQEDEGMEETGLTEGQKMMIALQDQIAGNGKREAPATSSLGADNVATPPTLAPQLPFGINNVTTNIRKQFGPQTVPIKISHASSPTLPTRTERRLSGIIRGPSNTSKFVAPIPLTKLQRQTKLAKSMPNLTDTSTANPESTKTNPDSSKTNPESSKTNPESSKTSVASESSGYKSGSSSLRTNLSLPNSRGSDVDYGYTTILSFSAPKPLETQRLGHVPVNSMAIPDECFQAVDVRLIHDVKTGPFQVGKLFETRQFLNSRSYSGNFADIFAEGLSIYLDITSESLDTSTMQAHQIFCETLEEGPNFIPYRMKKIIIPTLTSTCWPQAALEWCHRKRKKLVDETNHVTFTWPTAHMITQIKRFGCHVVPVGFMPSRGENKTRDLEWRLAFPEAERYLESCLSHAQVRCYMFTLALYKDFLEPMNAELGLTTENIRTQLLWQCERNYLAWPEDRPGETLRKFLDSLYSALKRETLPDYFVTDRNQFESTPRSHLRRVQEKLFRMCENLTMHVLTTVRNLRHVNEGSFYPRLDYRKLYDILTAEDVLPLVNPALARTAQNHQAEPEPEEDSEDESLIDMWANVRKNDPGRQWNKKVNRQIEAEKVAQKLTHEFRRHSVDSIDLEIMPGKRPEPMRRQLLLEFFIPHFIEMARKSNEFRAPKQGIMYMDHAECLVKLLTEEPSQYDSARKLLLQIRTLRESSTVGHNELKSPAKLPPTSPTLIPNSYKKVESPTQKSPPIHELPPVPPCPSQLPVNKALSQPAAKSVGLKRSSFVFPEQGVSKSFTTPKVHKNPTIAMTNNKPFSDSEQSIILEASITEESTDYDLTHF